MTLEAQGAGIAALAFETSSIGNYTTPTKYFPIISETLKESRNKFYRKSIRGLVEPWGVEEGPKFVEGDITFEVLDDVLPYFLYAGRFDIAKSGTTPDFTYIATPGVFAKGTVAGAGRSLTIVIDRASQEFYYCGCNVTQLAFSIDEGTLICTASILGFYEDQTESDTLTYVDPDGALLTMSKHDIKLNTVQRSDIADFSMTINDNGNAEHRPGIQSSKPSFISWGERDVRAKASIDFDTTDDYDDFQDNSQQTLVLTSTLTAAREVKIDYKAAVFDSYAVNLGSLGDLTRAEIEWVGLWDATATKSLEITVLTGEELT